MNFREQARRHLTLDRTIEAVIIFAGVARFMWGPMTPLRGDWSWPDLTRRSQEQIWGSSHGAQITIYELSRHVFRHWREPELAALHSGARTIGLFYVFAVILWSRALAGVDRYLFLVIALLMTPVTVYFAGNEELGFYWLPFFMVGAWMVNQRDSRFGDFGALFAGVGAALHGLGFFFLPAILDVPRTARRGATNILRLAIFFGPNGAALLFYFLFFGKTKISPGDSNGGDNGSLFLPFTKQENGHYFGKKTILIVLEILILTTPAIFLWLARLPFVKNRRPMFTRLLALGACGLGFSIFFNPYTGGPAIFDFDMYAASLAPLHLGAVIGVLATLPRQRARAWTLRILLLLGCFVVTSIFARWTTIEELSFLGLPSFHLVWYH